MSPISSGKRVRRLFSAMNTSSWEQLPIAGGSSEISLPVMSSFLHCRLPIAGSSSDSPACVNWNSATPLCFLKSWFLPSEVMRPPPSSRGLFLDSLASGSFSFFCLLPMGNGDYCIWATNVYFIAGSMHVTVQWLQGSQG